MNRFLLFVGIVLASCQSRTTEKHEETEVPVLPSVELRIGILITDSLSVSTTHVAVEAWKLANELVQPGFSLFYLCSACPSILNVAESLPVYDLRATTLVPRVDLLMLAASPVDSATSTFVRSRSREVSYFVSAENGMPLLAETGLLQAHFLTTRQAQADRLRISDTFMKSQYKLVHDRKIITTQGDLTDATLYLLDFLYGKPLADSISSRMGLPQNASRAGIFRAE